MLNTSNLSLKPINRKGLTAPLRSSAKNRAVFGIVTVDSLAPGHLTTPERPCDDSFVEAPAVSSSPHSNWIELRAATFLDLSSETGPQGRFCFWGLPNGARSAPALEDIGKLSLHPPALRAPGLSLNSRPPDGPTRDRIGDTGGDDAMACACISWAAIAWPVSPHCSAG